MNDTQLRNAAARTTLFAKLTPFQKSRVISALKAAGNTVGFLGDGINDAAALREADVGISNSKDTFLAKLALRASLVYSDGYRHYRRNSPIYGDRFSDRVSTASARLLFLACRHSLHLLARRANC